MKKIGSILLIVLLCVACKDNAVSKEAPETTSTTMVDPLPSWNEVETKQAIMSYVTDVTNTESANDMQNPHRFR